MELEINHRKVKYPNVIDHAGIAAAFTVPNNADPNRSVRFMEASWVDCSDIKSRWQANFAQRFPFNMDNLPQFHESDKAFFDNNWKGPKEWFDMAMTYENFMFWSTNYKAAPETHVAKKSGNPFKSGSKIARVMRIVEREVPSAPDKDGNRHDVKRMAYEFYGEEQGYVVDMCQCFVVEPGSAPV